MGNQLSGIAPAQILSAENYFVDLPKFQYESSLGSTRFLKVARAKHKEGYVVVKVFVIHDPSLPLKSWQEELTKIAEKVSGFVNVLPFQRLVLTDRAGFMIRQYLHDNLYDRISTRPFLTAVEKKWIVFQLLCALEQIHNVNICHGDIKTENIMITSWNWLLLTDMAHFKPVFLPADNPSDFNYFFDTSRRRTCCLAPERFVGSEKLSIEPADPAVDHDDSTGKEFSNATLPLLDVPAVGQGDLTPAMDIFSAGCVIAELFCEGQHLFDLSQLLAYRTLDYNPEVKISKIDGAIKDMILHMISKDPHQRMSAKEYMSVYRERVFPEEFYTFLKNYFGKFARVPVMTADDKIARLARDMDQIKKALYHEQESDDQLDKKHIPETDNCFVMIVSLVTTCVRSLKFSISKMTALDLMVDLAHYVSDELILELILPYMFFLVNDTVPRVRAHSVTTITKCVQLVATLPKNEGNIFPEYILPNLSNLADDPEVIVQCAFAENIALLAETALRFLELAQFNNISSSGNGKDDQSQYQVSYDMELHALHELIQQKVVSLLTSSDNIVKRTLMENGLTRLCVFFGRQKANDVLLSHIITFLNDKIDWQLRGAFFDSIVGMAMYIGWHCLDILKPLLQQGLKDTEEYVVLKALRALVSMSNLQLLQKPSMLGFMHDIVPFLCHPNRWIRYGAVGYIVSCSNDISLADMFSSVAPLVRPYLLQPIIQMDNQPILISGLDEPIPRTIFDFVVKSPQTPQLFEKLALSHTSDLSKDQLQSLDDGMSQIMRRLKSQGMVESTESKLLYLKNIIIRLNLMKSNSDLLQSTDRLFPGVLDVSALNIVPQSRQILLSQLAESASNSPSPASVELDSGKLKEQITISSVSPNKIGDNLNQSPPENPESDKASTEPVKDTRSDSVYSMTAVTDQAKYSICKCKQDLQKLALHKCDVYLTDTKAKSLLQSVIEGKGKQAGWKPKGQLVSHLHEHKAAINRVVVSGDHNFFATASNDSTVKIWDTQRLESKSLVTRSKYTYSKQVGKINCLTFCHNSTMIACSSDDASIHVFRIDGTGSGPGSSKLALLIEKKLYVHEEGIAVDMHQFDSGNQNIITYATVHGYICGWDLRQPKERYAWRFKNDQKLGLITSFTVDPFQCWITCGTTDGSLVCWDMRFQLPITQISHPRNARVWKVSTHPLEQSWIVASFEGNNEVSMWDLETSANRQTLWASRHPPLSQSQVSHDTVLTLLPSDQESKTFFLTGGTDRRIRLWDLRQPNMSSIVASAASDNLEHVALKYNNRLIDGTEVIYETYEKKRSNISYDEHPRKGAGEAPSGHQNCISDIALTRLPQNFLISASTDGVVKVWK